uniref:EGF-like domain-containing protein n=1 Tax=Aquila chrysaetos chrysaetos TaxID=223781 RepID=A0A663EZP8_AQUCH
GTCISSTGIAIFDLLNPLTSGDNCVESSRYANKANFKSIRLKLVAQLSAAEVSALFAQQISCNNFLFLTVARELNRNCCQNGGTCFLGTFCICPKYFTGRHCEHDKSIKFCGTVRHGEWDKDSCPLCQCVHGVLHCFPHGLRDSCGKRHRMLCMMGLLKPARSCPFLLFISKFKAHPGHCLYSHYLWC